MNVRRIQLLIICLFYTCLLFAGSYVKIKPEPFWILPRISAATNDPDLKNVSNGYYFDLMDRQVNLDNQSEYLHIIRHIVNTSGVQEASEVSVKFAPQYQQVVFHKITVIRNGRSIDQLDISSIKTSDEENEASDFEYSGKKRAYLILKDVQKGDLIDISYTVVGFNPVFRHLYTDYFYFYSQTPVVNYYLSILTSSATPLHFKEFNNAMAPLENSHGQYTVYQWKNPDMGKTESGSSAPDWFTTIPHVYISEFADWKQVTDWGLSIFNHYQYPLPEKLLRKMVEWKKVSSGNPDMFANLALRFVQDQIRYLALEMGTYTHQPHTPSDVFNHRFGDCKDKALLLTVILQHENIESYVAFTNTNERDHLSEAASTPLAFNHAIVALKRSAGWSFVDPTIALQRGELVNSFIPAYGWALVIKTDENTLSAVEPGRYSSSDVTESIRVSLEDTSFLGVTSIYKGGAADNMRDDLSTSSADDLKDGYLKYYQKLFSGILSDSACQVRDDSIKNEIQIDESYKVPGLWHETDSTKKEFDVYAKLVAGKFPDPADHKVNEPVSLNFPCTLQYTLRIHFPEDWPADVTELHIKNSSYQFDFTFEIKGNIHVYKYYFKSFRDNIPAKDFNQYSADYKEISKNLSLWFSRTNVIPDKPYNKGFNPVTNLNWQTIWLSFFMGVVLTILFNHLNRKSKPSEPRMNAGLPLGGWAMFLGISLILRLIIQGYYFVSQGYYEQSSWNNLRTNGGAGLQGIFIAELIVSLFCLAATLAMIYWFFKKRDIFPGMMVYYVSSFVIAQFFLLVLYYTVHQSFDLTSVKATTATQLFRTIIYAAVWSAYVVRSERVRQTFVYPYS